MASTVKSSRSKRISIPELRRAIARLPADAPVKQPGVWYLTQKEHWLGWLKYYNTEGAYGRRPGLNRDARYAYNHIVEPKMLLWLLPAVGVSPVRVRAARSSAAREKTMMAQSAAIRRVVPWEVVAEALWPGRTIKNGTERKIR